LTCYYPHLGNGTDPHKKDSFLPQMSIVNYQGVWYKSTMFAKTETPVSASVRAYRQELEHLYARRSAVDSLIESLEEYDRVREAARAEDSKRQTA
jgi:hypothetical protein